MAFVFLFVWIFLPSVVLAKQDPTVLINEIAWMGSSVDGAEANQHWRYEWLELFNAKDVSISLVGWSIELARDEVEFAIPLSGTIAKEGYFLVAASDKVPNLNINYANLGGKFMNSGMRVVLKDANGVIVDEVDAKEGWPAGDNKRKLTMERIVGGWQTSSAAGGTPQQKNSMGLQESSLSENIFLANKKDPSGSFLKESVFSFPAVLAFLLALGAAAGVLWLRHRLFRRA